MLRKLLLLLSTAALLGSATASTASAEGPGRLIGPSSACPGQARLGASPAAQEATMRCMVDFARTQTGLAPLAVASELEQSAGDKVDDILRCNSFSHFACGREFDYWMRQTGYASAQCWRVGENLGWGTGIYGSVRAIFRAWMGSPGHRENILGEFSELGVHLQVGTLEGRPRTHVWSQHFGSHCEPSAQA